MSRRPLFTKSQNLIFALYFTSISLISFASYAQDATATIQNKISPVAAGNLPLGQLLAIHQSTALAGGGEYRPTGPNGVLHILSRSGNSWAVAQTINQRFDSAAIYGDTIVLGARFNDASDISGAGVVHIYNRTGSTWQLRQTLTAKNTDGTSDIQKNAYFGVSVSIDGNKLVAGAFNTKCQDQEGCGAAYIYELVGGEWSIRQKLTAKTPSGSDDSQPGALFGAALSISGNKVIIGAPRLACIDGLDCGAAYIYSSNGDTWTPQDKLIAKKSDGSVDSHSGAWFGQEVRILGNTAAVGAPLQNCNQGERCGAAYVYSFANSAWPIASKLLPQQSDQTVVEQKLAYFGQSIGISDSMIVVGAPGMNCSVGVNCGSLFLYKNEINKWFISEFIQAQTPDGELDTGSQENFGGLVANYGNDCIVSSLRRYPENAGSMYHFAIGKPHQLTITKTGGGSEYNSVSSSPAGIQCGQYCTSVFAETAKVSLLPMINPGYAFTDWGGDCSGQNSCIVTMDSPKNISANFVAAHPLVVAKSGSGLVTSNPAGINCGTECKASFKDAIYVTLSAKPVSGYAFKGWGDACAGTGDCVLQMNSPKSVTATFVPTFNLTVSKAGNGFGLITSAPSDINCGPTCTAAFQTGTNVTLIANPLEGSIFTGWGGACSGMEQCIVSMTSAKSVTAKFALKYDLSVTKLGPGTVTSYPSGINCGESCVASFESNTNVTLNAKEQSNSIFKGWSGACSGSSSSCTLSMVSARDVTAEFTEAFLLSMNKTGQGTIKTSVPGASCGSICVARAPKGFKISFTAIPDAGYKFDHWEGACTGNGTCDLVIDSDTTVTAVFTRLGAQYIVGVSKIGAGTITSTPGGIFCGTACNGIFTEGTTLSLTAKPETGYVFSGWSGDCKGTNESCTLSVSSPMAITATFTELPKYLMNIKKPIGGILVDGRGLVNCGGINRQCSGTFSSISLTATPNPGYTLKKWIGCPSPIGNTCNLTLTQKTTVGAVFAKLPKYALKIVKSRNGEITSDPAGLKCKDTAKTCSARFVSGTRVRLTANPLSGYRFTGWSGACTGTAACEVTMDAKKLVGAQFE